MTPPLFFDEASGRSVTRLDFVLQKLDEAMQEDPGRQIKAIVVGNAFAIRLNFERGLQASGDVNGIPLRVQGLGDDFQALEFSKP